MNRSFLFITIFFFTSNLIAQVYTSDSGAYTISNGSLTVRETPPIWPGCESETLDDKNACFEQKLREHISQNFIVPYEIFNKIEAHEILVSFIITKRGTAKIRKIKGGIPEIREIAEQTILSIPTVIPGNLGGKKITSLYEVPISY